MKIAVDAMGGDHAPEVIVQGAIAAARDQAGRIILVGDREAIERSLDAHADTSGLDDLIEIHHCTQTAGMDESPVDVLRYKKDSSIRVVFDLIKAGEADAAVSAGNSGATLAVGTIVLGRIDGVDRPGIAGVFPTPKGRTVVIDVGANVDCKPAYLYQFGVMAEAFCREIIGVNKPRVGLLSIGEEDSKGNDLVLKAHDLFRDGPLNFIGNVEGRDVITGVVDVIVCDGFVGNVVLKMAEGMAEAINLMLKDEISAGLLSRIGYLLSQGAFKRFKKRVDYAEFGGAPLLGINGIGIISHGRSSPKAIKNAIRVAGEMARADLLGRLRHSLQEKLAGS